MIKVGLVGAFDRNNFGDLLMPIIFELQYRNAFPNRSIKFNYFGLQESHLSNEICSYDTQPLSKLYDQDVVVVVGGEVLGSSYSTMYMNTKKSKTMILALKIFKKIFPKYFENYARYSFKLKTKTPWIINKDIVKAKYVVYNTVGGEVTDEADLEILKKADYISLRNLDDFKKVKKISNNAYLYPDSVSYVPKVISKDFIASKIKTDIKKIGCFNYFIFQVNIKNSQPYKKIAKKIQEICSENDVHCVLLPIGYAQGHEDHVALKKIFRKIDGSIKNYVHMVDGANIYETLYILQNSKLFIGTSLHGNIVSQAYGIPHLFYTGNITKGLKYATTWYANDVNMVYTDIENMKELFLEFYDNSKMNVEISENAKKIQRLVKENFDNINTIINNCDG